MKPPIEAYRFTSRIVPLDAGLHGIRYQSEASGGELPSVMIQALPDDASAVDYLPSPGGTPGCLVRPGEMLILRAHRRVHVVATIVTITPLGNPDGLQIRVEHLDRPGTGSRESGPVRRKALPAHQPARQLGVVTNSKSALSAVEIVSTHEVAGNAEVGQPASALKALEPQRPSLTRIESNGPGMTVGVLLQGIRSWRIGSLHDIASFADDRGVVGVRASVLAGEDAATHLRLHVRMSDGRFQESLGREVRVEAVGRSLISAASIQYRSAKTPTWTTILEHVFQIVT